MSIEDYMIYRQYSLVLHIPCEVYQTPKNLTQKQSLRKDSIFFWDGVPNATKIRITISTWIQIFARVILHPVFSRHFSTKNWNHITASQPHHHRSEALNIEVLDSLDDRRVFFRGGSWEDVFHAKHGDEQFWNILKIGETYSFQLFEASQSKQIWCVNLANTKNDRFFCKAGLHQVYAQLNCCFGLVSWVFL